jgi:peroxidase
MMKCMLVQSPFNCTPSNALEELVWKPAPHMGKNARWFDKYWLTELNLIGKLRVQQS